MLDSWNNALLDSIRAENTHPCVAARALAIVHGAMFDTAAAIHRAQPFYAAENVPGDLPLDPALNSAAFSTATNLFPSRAAAFRDLYARLLPSTPECSRRPEALRLGRTIADAWITWRVNDHSSGSLPYIPRKDVGAWRRTPPFIRPPEMQHWARVIPFTLVSAAQFRPPGPPPLDSPQYTADFDAVKNLGAARSTTRSAHQSETAHFWSDFSYTVTPPGHWNQAAQAVAAARALSLEQRIKLFAVLNITLSDVAVACWDAKYVYDFWRPVTAVRAAADDANDSTAPDADWLPLLNTPAFPEYVSGHSAFSGAGAIILAHFNGGDGIEFSLPSDSLPGARRTYRSLWACAEEVSQSRLYGGIHFPSALRDGLTLGRQVAHHLLENYFLPHPPKHTPQIFTAPGELNRAPWLGLAAPVGTPITIQHLTPSGSWTIWTNTIASAPTTRWHLPRLRDASDFRLKFP